MAFKFSLATVLRVRQIAEEREERLLEQILQQLANALRAVTKADCDIATCDSARASVADQSCMAWHVHASYAELAQLKKERAALVEQFHSLQQLKEIQIKAYNAARCNREALTEMCGRRREAYDAEVALREQHVLDDNFIARKRRA